MVRKNQKQDSFYLILKWFITLEPKNKGEGEKEEKNKIK